MNESDKLYEGAGDLTTDSLDELLYDEYSFIDDDDNYTEEYLLEYKFKSFSEGLTEYIRSHGYSGDMDSIDDKTDFIKQKCKDNNVTLNPSVVKTWFKDKRPRSGAESRTLVYKLCFALNMNAKEAADFFYKVYFECPFNFRIPDEAVIYYCLNNNKSYSEAELLKGKVKSILEIAKPSEYEYDLTTAIGKDISNIQTDEDFLDYISKNSAEFVAGNKTAYKYASKLITAVTDLAKKRCENKEELKHRLGKDNNIDLFIYDLFGEDINQFKKDKSFSKASEFPELIKSNFPLKMQLSKVRNNEQLSYDTMRKALIELFFYKYFAELFEANTDEYFCIYEDDFRGYVAETNDLLFSCGYPQLYVRNPYDWLFMHCANTPYPLEEFQNAVKRYYLDNI